MYHRGRKIFLKIFIARMLSLPISRSLPCRRSMGFVAVFRSFSRSSAIYRLAPSRPVVSNEFQRIRLWINRYSFQYLFFDCALRQGRSHLNSFAFVLSLSQPLCHTLHAYNTDYERTFFWHFRGRLPWRGSPLATRPARFVLWSLTMWLLHRTNAITLSSPCLYRSYIIPLNNN